MSRITHEQELVDRMIRLYCKAHHTPRDLSGLCSECAKLASYAHHRLNLCPWGENKGFCSHCPTQCYASNQKKKIKQIMRWAGYRMVWYEPRMVIAHLWGSFKAWRRRIGRSPKLETKRQTKENGRG